MTTMDRLTDLLGDVDELLDDADAQTITESLERGESPDHADVDDGCPWCGHGFHGLGCYVPPVYVGTFGDVDDWAFTLTEPTPHECGCDSSLTRRDDTWRPFIFDSSQEQHLKLMDETGLDGWAARIELLHRLRANYEEAQRARREAHERSRRENLNRILCRHMDETGLDGWAAAADRARSSMTMSMNFTLAVDPAAVNAAFASAGSAVEAVVGSIRAGVASIGEIVADIGGITVRHPGFRGGRVPPAVQIGEWLAPPPVPLEEPELTAQQRALQLRRDRNTGPERPSAGRARRPRRHGG